MINGTPLKLGSGGPIAPIYKFIELLTERGEQPRRVSVMEYKAFVIRTFERDPGRWRARIWRANGKPLRAGGRKKEFVTSLDAPTAAAALSMAMRVIDAGTFSCSGHKGAYTEKFWRRR